MEDKACGFQSRLIELFEHFESCVLTEERCVWITKALMDGVIEERLGEPMASYVYPLQSSGVVLCREISMECGGG